MHPTDTAVGIGSCQDPKSIFGNDINGAEIFTSGNCIVGHDGLKLSKKGSL